MNTSQQDKGNAGNEKGNDKNEKLISLIIVVNTTPTTVKINENVPLKAAAEKALEQTHNTGRPLSDYELKFHDKVLDMDKKVKEYGLKDGDELFLSLKAGTGGAR